MGNESSVNQSKNGQYRTTVPKGLADSMNLDGKKLRWFVKSGNRLEVEVVD